MGLTATYRKIISLADVPVGVPRRYTDVKGYVILRWKVGQRQYAEVKEHRLVMGMPPSGIDVHHINGIKSDNRPENLQLITRGEHSNLHHGPKWNVAQAADDYAAGMSYPEIGRKYGTHTVSAMRLLKKHGVVSRPRPGSSDYCKHGHRFVPSNTNWWKGKRICKECVRIRTKAAYRLANPGSKHYRDKWRDPESGQWLHVATERVIGVSETRGA